MDDFEKEASEVMTQKEASPWAHLQKTYSNVEESAHSLSAQQLPGNAAALPAEDALQTVSDASRQHEEVQASLPKLHGPVYNYLRRCMHCSKLEGRLPYARSLLMVMVFLLLAYSTHVQPRD